MKQWVKQLSLETGKSKVVLANYFVKKGSLYGTSVLYGSKRYFINLLKQANNYSGILFQCYKLVET